MPYDISRGLGLPVWDGMLEAVRWLYTQLSVLYKAMWDQRPGCTHLSRSLILTAAAAAQPQQKAGMQLWGGQWYARIAHAEVAKEGRITEIVGWPGRYQKSMVERVVIEDGISDGTVIEAVAISAESLPQTFLLGPISNSLAGIVSLNQALMMPAAQSPSSGPPALCLPEGVQ